MIELFILFFIIAFSLSFGWVMGKRIGDIIATLFEFYWYTLLEIPRKTFRFATQFFLVFSRFLKKIWYWKVRRPKLVKTMREDPLSDDATWALAERLNPAKHKEEWRLTPEEGDWRKK